jgi:hypothetical protein
MNPNMLFQVRGLIEALATKFAFEWPFSCVNPHVNIMTVFGCHHFSTQDTRPSLQLPMCVSVAAQHLDQLQVK